MTEEQQLIYNELMSKYNFDEGGSDEIKLGLEKELDISWYVKPEFNEYQMREIRRSLEKGIEVSVYAKSEFNDG